jgi:hypothetical protein
MHSQAGAALARALPRDVNVVALERMTAFAVSLSSALAPRRVVLSFPLGPIPPLEGILAWPAGSAAVALVNDVVALSGVAPLAVGCKTALVPGLPTMAVGRLVF